MSGARGTFPDRHAAPAAFCVLSFAFCVSSSAAADVPPYKDTSLPFEKRVADLVGRMTLDEKAAQMQMDVAPVARLGIPRCQWWSEAIHGVSRAGAATIFPQAIGMSATWDVPLLGRIGEATADEARAKFDPNGARYRGLMLWAPTINMARDPRWGRTEETYGEDPFLTSRLAVAFCKGLQGDDPKYLKTVATPKHFAMHSQETLRTSSSFDIDERNLREYYLPAFQACFTEARAASTMAAHNGINGIPCPANPWLLTDLLRNEWGFQGAVVSDYRSLVYLVNSHHFSPNNEQAVAASINAGLDIISDEPQNNYPAIVAAAVQHGRITQETLDRSVTRSLLLRFRLGMFDPPDMLPFKRTPASSVGSKEHIALTLQAARESFVLLKNDPAPKGYGFEKLLPLDLRRIRTLAVVGPYATTQYYGAYSGSPVTNSPTPLEVLRTAVGDRVIVRTADYGDIDGSLRIAESADVVIAVMGLNGRVENEGVDRGTLELPIDQLIFLERICRANPLTVVVLEGGSPIGCSRFKDRAPAIMMTWYPGEQGGPALAETLLGQSNPSGRLPVTFYNSIADLPPLNDYDITHGRTYMYLQKPPNYAFGHGLSYTAFDYANLRLTKPTAAMPWAPADTITVSADITNSGPCDGDEVVQLYVHKPNSAVTRPLKQLKAFQRVTIPKGATKTVALKFAASDLAYWDTPNHKFTVEPGPYDLLLGAASDDIRLKTTLEIP